MNNESPKRSVRLGSDLDAAVDREIKRTRKTFSELVRATFSRLLGVEDQKMKRGRRHKETK